MKNSWLEDAMILTQSQVWCPWVKCMFGELQYELLLAIFWENMYEPSTFGPRKEPLFPFGRPLPPAPPQTQVLGVDKSQPPKWKVDVNVRSLHGSAERLPSMLHSLGCGPDLGRVANLLYASDHSLFLRMRLAHLLSSPYSTIVPRAAGSYAGFSLGDW